jgi:hypothetical protein
MHSKSLPIGLTLLAVVQLTLLSACQTRDTEEDASMSSQEQTETGDSALGEKASAPSATRAENNEPASTPDRESPEEKLTKNPMIRELARRAESDIPGLQVKYEYDGEFGSDGIADRGSAYLNGKLIGEAKALRIVREEPTKLEVEERYYSDSGSLAYLGTALFVLGNVWKAGDTPVPTGSLLTSTAIKGRKERILFNHWPAGGPSD